MHDLKSYLFSLLPESLLKNRIRSFVYNRSQTEFKITFRDQLYYVIFPTFTLRFPINPYHMLLEQPAYFKNYIPKRGDVVIDGGAFAGTVTAYLSNLVGPEGKVIAFEPDDQNFKLLQQTITLNNLENVIAINAGIWSKPDVLKFHNTHYLGASFLNISEEEQDVIHVPVRNIDTVLEEYGLTKLDFIKMDIEGAEMEALEGANKILTSNNVHLAIASYHIVNGSPTYLSLEPFLKHLGYKVKTVHDKEIITYATQAGELN